MSSDDPRIEYADIIDLPYRKNPARKHMSMEKRAAQFAPFAALSGYEAMVKEEMRLTEKEHELSEYETEVLNRKLSVIKNILYSGRAPEITVTYFVPDKYKSGGAYNSVTLPLKAIDVTMRRLILYGSCDISDRKADPVIIDLDRIRDIKCRETDYLEE